MSRCPSMSRHRTSELDHRRQSSRSSHATPAPEGTAGPPPERRTVNPPIALGSFQPPLLFLNAALRPVASRRLPERLGPRASVTNVRIPTDAINRGRLACRSSGGRIASNERAIEESQDVLVEGC